MIIEYRLLHFQIGAVAFKEVADFRLWNSTLVEDYPKVDMVKIGSNAKIVIPPRVVIQQENLKDDYATVSPRFFLYYIVRIMDVLRHSTILYQLNWKNFSYIRYRFKYTYTLTK